MYAVTNANNQYDLFTGKNKDAVGIGDDAFSQILGTRFSDGFGNDASIHKILDHLEQRFPNATIHQGEVSSGVKGTQEFFGEGEGDQIAVENAALSAMATDPDFLKNIQDAITAFFDGTAASAPQGLYAQRSVSITITTIRFTVSHRDIDTGELQTSNELKTALQEKLRELISKFFGVPALETDEADETEQIAETEKSTDKTGYQFGGVMWSMELYYSATYIQGISQNDFGSFSTHSWQFSASFSQVTGSLIPGALGQWLDSSGGGSSGSGPFSSLLDGLLSGFGISSDGLSQADGGWMLRIRESRNLMAELMELYSSRVQPNIQLEEPEAAEDAAGTENTTPAEIPSAVG